MKDTSTVLYQCCIQFMGIIKTLYKSHTMTDKECSKALCACFNHLFRGLFSMILEMSKLLIIHYDSTFFVQYLLTLLTLITAWHLELTCIFQSYTVQHFFLCFSQFLQRKKMSQHNKLVMSRVPNNVSATVSPAPTGAGDTKHS